MQRNIFDTHAHYTSGAFNKDRHQLLQNLPGQGVALVVDCATDYDSALQSLELARQYSYIYTAVGIHPESIIEENASTNARFGGNWREELQQMRPLYQNPKVVAVGECGLDHHWPVPKEEQLALFEAEIQTALELDLPIIVHDREAHAEVYALLKQYKPKGVLHAYSGSAEDAAWLCAQGMYIGLGGVVTFKNARRAVEVAANLPAEKLLLETDCPYMTPVPYRGKRNNSAYILYIAQTIAQIRGVAAEEVLNQTLQNGKTLFGIA